MLDNIIEIKKKGLGKFLIDLGNYHIKDNLRMECLMERGWLPIRKASLNQEHGFKE